MCNAFQNIMDAKKVIEQEVIRINNLMDRAASGTTHIELSIDAKYFTVRDAVSNRSTIIDTRVMRDIKEIMSNL